MVKSSATTTMPITSAKDTTAITVVAGTASSPACELGLAGDDEGVIAIPQLSSLGPL